MSERRNNEQRPEEELKNSQQSEEDLEPSVESFNYYWQMFCDQIRLEARLGTESSNSDTGELHIEKPGGKKKPEAIASVQIGVVSRVNEFLTRQHKTENSVHDHNPNCQACHSLESPITRMQYKAYTPAGVMLVIGAFLDFANQPTELATISYCSLVLLDKFIDDHSESFDMSDLVYLVCRSKFPLKTINSIGYSHLLATKKLLPVEFFDQWVMYFFHHSRSVTDIKCLVLLMNIVEDKYRASDLSSSYWNRFEMLAMMGNLDSKVIYTMSQLLVMRTMPQSEIFERPGGK